jgi:hypothetical protein
MPEAIPTAMPRTNRPVPPISPDAPSTDSRKPAAAVPLNLYLSDLRRLFDSMDPAPFRERDLDPDAAAYIVEWAEETRAKQSLRMVVHLGACSDLEADARLIRESVHEFFQQRAAATRRRLRQLLRRGRISLVIALVFLGTVIAVSEWFAAAVAHERTAAIIENSLVIGAWVALWRPLEIFLYDWWPIRDAARLYDRLGTMAIDVVHEPARSSEGANPSGGGSRA